MAVRSTQAVIASLSAGGGLAHSTQCIVVALETGPASARASQISLQALGKPVASARATQATLQSLTNATARLRASQFTLQVLVWNFEVVMPALYPALVGLTYSVIKRPKWFTGIGTSATGREVRVAYAENPLWEWDLTYNYLPDQQTATSTTPSDFKQLIGFYLSQSGSFGGFMFEDPDDNTVITQPLGTTDGTTTTWILQRTLGGSDGTGSEPIGWLNTGKPSHVFLDGGLVDPSLYSFLTTIGVSQQLRFVTAPSTGQAITASFSYYFSVRFKDDHNDFEKFMDKLWSVQTITLMSQRN